MRVPFGLYSLVACSKTIGSPTTLPAAANVSGTSIVPDAGGAGHETPRRPTTPLNDGRTKLRGRNVALWGNGVLEVFTSMGTQPSGSARTTFRTAAVSAVALSNDSNGPRATSSTGIPSS